MRFYTFLTLTAFCSFLPLAGNLTAGSLDYDDIGNIEAPSAPFQAADSYKQQATDFREMPVGGDEYSSTYGGFNYDRFSGFRGEGDDQLFQNSWQGSPVTQYGYDLGNNSFAPPRNNSYWQDWGQGSYNRLDDRFSDLGYGNQGTFNGNYPIDGLEQQNIFGDLTSWMPTVEELLRLPPEQRRVYERKIKEHADKVRDWVKDRIDEESARRQEAEQKLRVQRAKEDNGLKVAYDQALQGLDQQMEKLKADEQSMNKSFRAMEKDLARRRREMSPVEAAMHREEIRQRRARQVRRLSDAKEQLKEQYDRLKDDFERRRSQLQDQRRQQDYEKRMQNLTYDVQARLAMLSLEPPLVRNKLNRPSFSTSGLLMSKRYVDIKREVIHMWKDQRKSEAARLREQYKLTSQLALMRYELFRLRRRSYKKIEYDRAKRDFEMKVRSSKRDIARRLQDIAGQRASLRAQRSIYELRVREWERQVNASGGAINVRQVGDILRKMREQYERQDAKLAADEDSLKTASAGLDKSARDRMQLLAEKQRNEIKELAETEKLEMGKLDSASKKAEMGLKKWEAERADEERRLDAEFRQWLEYQNQLRRQWEQVRR